MNKIRAHKYVSLGFVLVILLLNCTTVTGTEFTDENPPPEDEADNRAPQILTPLNGQSFQFLEGQLNMVSVKAYDPDGDSVQLSAMSLPLSAGFSHVEGYAAIGFITWAPSSSDVGSHEVDLYAIDEHGGMCFVTITLQVIPVVPVIRFEEPVQTYYSVKEMEFMGFEVKASGTGDMGPISITHFCNPPIPLSSYLFKQDVYDNPAVATFAWTPDIGASKLGTHLVILTASSGPYSITRTVKIDVEPNTEFLQDLDKDGIYNEVDPFPITPSNEFADIYGGGTTTGTILRGDQIVKVWDAPNPQGVYVSTDPSGGSTPATVICCAQSTYSLGPGTTMRIDCESVRVRVLDGTVNAVIPILDGEATITIPRGNEVYYNPTNNTFVTHPLNEETLNLTIDDRQYELGPSRIYSPEEGDSWRNAVEVEINTSIDSTLEEGEQDYYRFQASPGTYLISTWGNEDPRLTLYDVDGETVLASDDDSGEDFNAFIEWECTEFGTYYLLVEGFTFEAEGEYAISVMEDSENNYYQVDNHLCMLVNYTWEFTPKSGRSASVIFKITELPDFHPYQDTKFLSAFAGGEPLPWVREETDAYGNRVDVYNKVFSETTNITVCYNMTLRSVDCRIIPDLVSEYDTSADMYNWYTGPEGSIESTHPAIISQAVQIVGNISNIYKMAERLCLWVYDNVEYGGGGYWSALETLERRVGVCEDMANLYVALCRAVGIPARVVIGNTYSPGIFQDECMRVGYMDAGGHAWAEVYIPGFGWLWGDPTWNWFGDNWLYLIGSGTRDVESFYWSQGDIEDDWSTYIELELLPLDTDGDNLTNYEEISSLSNPYLSDSDMDGLSDYEEIRLYDTYPDYVDSDRDELPDGEEVHTYRTDPTSSDSDGDYLMDGEEVRRYSTDPLKADTDGDGLNDYSEVKCSFTDPSHKDTDEDGYDDGYEVSNDSDPLTPSGSVIITVLDEDGDPISGLRAEVVSNQNNETLEVTTDALGHIELAFIDEGGYTLTLTGEGYTEYSEVFAVRSGETNAVLVELEKSGHQISGFPLAAILLGLLVAMTATKFILKRP